MIGKYGNRNEGWQDTGAHPWTQGYLACSDGRDRVPPDWHPITHRDKRWLDNWYNGYDTRRAENRPIRKQERKTVKFENIEVGAILHTGENAHMVIIVGANGVASTHKIAKDESVLIAKLNGAAPVPSESEPELPLEEPKTEPRTRRRRVETAPEPEAPKAETRMRRRRAEPEEEVETTVTTDGFLEALDNALGEDEVPVNTAELASRLNVPLAVVRAKARELADAGKIISTRVGRENRYTFPDESDD